MLKGRKIILGVTGSIAAYKSAVLTRLLVKSGAHVQVIMTDSATEFITPLTLSVLSRNPVLSAFSDPKTGSWNNHVDLGLHADALVIAPASARTLARMSTGQADNLLTAVYLSARCPVFFAPAMDLDMLRHPSVREAIGKLKSWGNHQIEPGEGELASGLIGPGRMAEPEEIVAHLERFFSKDMPLAGRKALVTAGPTWEAIDPVRFIGNHSSGKMGFAVARALAEAGADVQLVTGPTNQTTDHPLISVSRVTSAVEMLEVCTRLFPASDIAVLAAAVADYRPSTTATEKIKKSDGPLVLELVSNPDIAATLGRQRRADQVICGFALESEHELANAREKMKRKDFDLIVLNSLRDAGAGFGYDTNLITVLDRMGGEKRYDLKSKQEAAQDIVRHIIGSMP